MGLTNFRTFNQNMVDSFTPGGASYLGQVPSDRTEAVKKVTGQANAAALVHKSWAAVTELKR